MTISERMPARCISLRRVHTGQNSFKLVSHGDSCKFELVSDVKTSLDFYGPSRIYCTCLRLSLTPSQTSRIPGAKELKTGFDLYGPSEINKNIPDTVTYL